MTIEFKSQFKWNNPLILTSFTTLVLIDEHVEAIKCLRQCCMKIDEKIDGNEWRMRRR
jgi:hypothetical protein